MSENVAMCDPPLLTRACDRTGPRRRARSTAPCLLLVLVAGVSCQADGVVQPNSRPVAGRTAPGPEARTRAQHVQVRALSDGHGIRGSGAILHRRSTGLAVRVVTRELVPGEPVDLFWAIFNNPAACTHPNPLTGAPCSPPDLFVAETQGSLHFVATLAAGARGELSYAATLAARSAAGCVGAPFPCHTLRSPFGAEVHSATFVPNGGAGRQAAQFLAP